MRTLPILTLLVSVCCAAALGAETSGFRSYLFDGTSFKESAGEGGLLVRDGFLPIVADSGIALEDPLPTGTGAVVLLCYRQISGGKLRKHSGAQPIAGVAVTVTGKGVTLASRTDDHGYLILALPPGSYELRLFNFTKRVSVEPGRTTLASMRGGKRMVD